MPGLDARSIDVCILTCLRILSSYLTSELLEGFPNEIPLKDVSQIIQETKEAEQEDFLNDITALISEEEKKEKLFATLRQDIGETGSLL